MDEGGEGRVSSEVFCRRLGAIDSGALGLMGKAIVGEALSEISTQIGSRISNQLRDIILAEFGHLKGSGFFYSGEDGAFHGEESGEGGAHVDDEEGAEIVGAESEEELFARLTNNETEEKDWEEDEQGQEFVFLSRMSMSGRPEDQESGESPDALPSGFGTGGNDDDDFYVAPSPADLDSEKPWHCVVCSFHNGAEKSGTKAVLRCRVCNVPREEASASLRQATRQQLVHNGKSLSPEQAASLLARLRPLGTRQRRVGGGLVMNQVLDPVTKEWLSADRSVIFSCHTSQHQRHLFQNESSRT